MTILYNIDTVEVHKLRSTIKNVTNSFTPFNNSNADYKFLINIFLHTK